MTFYTALLLLAAIVLALIGILALLMWLEKKLPSRQYDERQQILRGKAHKWALITGFCYFFIIAALEAVLPGTVQADLFLVIMVGLSLEIFVLGCYCVFHDAYLPLTKSPKVTIIVLYVMGAVHLIHAVSCVNSMKVTLTEQEFTVRKFGEVMLNGTGRSATVWALLMVAVMSVTLATMQLLRYQWNNME